MRGFRWKVVVASIFLFTSFPAASVEQTSIDRTSVDFGREIGENPSPQVGE
jgi:hypothetical protein